MKVSTSGGSSSGGRRGGRGNKDEGNKKKSKTCKCKGVVKAKKQKKGAESEEYQRMLEENEAEIAAMEEENRIVAVQATAFNALMDLLMMRSPMLRAMIESDPEIENTRKLALIIAVEQNPDPPEEGDEN